MEYEEIESFFADKTLADLLAMRDYLNDNLFEPIVDRINQLWKDAVCAKGQRLDNLTITPSRDGVVALCELVWSYDGDMERFLEITIPYDVASDTKKCAAFFQSYKEQLQEKAENAKKLEESRRRAEKVAALHRLLEELSFSPNSF